MKKALSLVLVIAMVLSSMSFAFAGTFTDVTGDYEKAIDTLAALGVITGYEDGTYRPERIVTRAEMAKLIVEILGYGDLVSGSKSNFTDTQGHWADAWIALAAGRGLVIGTGDGKFTPDRQVSYDEAITMVVRALGYTDNSNELKGMTWPTNFKVKAAELDLLDDVVLAANGADRGGVAQLLYNALEATLVTVTTDGDVTYLFDTVDGEKEERLLLSRLATKKNITVFAENIDKDSKHFLGDVVDLEQYMYQDITVYVNKDGDVVYVKGTNNLVLTGILNDADDIKNNKLTVEDADGDDYVFVLKNSTDVMVNGVETSLDNLKYEKADVKVTVVLDAEEDDKLKDGYDVIGVVAEKATGEILVSREYVDGRTRFSGIALPLDKDDDVDMDKITVEGAVEELVDVAEDSVVTVYAGLDADNDLVQIKFVVSADAVEGKISKASHDKASVTIGGKAYDASAFADKGSVVVGETGTLYLNADGEFLEFVSEDEEEAGDYAVVVSRSNGTYDDFLEANDKDAKVKLATAADKEIIYSLAEEAEINGVELKPTGDDIIVTTKLTVGEVYEYSLDKDGKIEWIEKVEFDRENVKLATDTKAFILADNAVIFDGYTADKYQVLKASELADDIKADVLYNKDGEIELLFVLDGVDVEKDGTFGIVTNVEVAVNDDDDTVFLITAYIDGEKVSYYSDEDLYDAYDGKATELRSAVRKEFKLNEFEMDGDVVTDVTTEDDFFTADVEMVAGKVYTVKAANDVFTILKSNGNTETVALADEAIIYEKTGTVAYSVADIETLDADDEDVFAKNEGSIVKAYDVDDDGEIDIVIIGEDDDTVASAPVVDKAALNDAIATAELKVEADYTAASWTAFQTALTAAKAMPEATQAEVNAKLAAVNAAIAKLVEVELDENTLEGTIEEGLSGDTILVDVEDADKVEKVTFNGVELDPANWEYAFDGNTVRIPVNAEIEEVVITIDGVDYLVVIE